MATKILIDSAADIDVKQASEMGISLISLIVTIDGQDYYDGRSLSPTEFYEKLIESNTFPTTTQVTPFRFEEEFSALTANGDDLVVITLSSKLSGTYGAALQASEKFAGKVYVVDSLNATVGERLLCQYALQLVKSGKNAQEVSAELDKIKHRVTVLAVLGTLEYLKKGGRISTTTALAGTLFSVKPVIAVVDGKVELIGKAIGSKKGNNLLNKIVEQKGGIDFSLPYGTLWSGLDKTMHDKYVADSAHIWQQHTDFVPSYILGPTIGTHVGPGAVGVAFFSKEN